MKLEWEEFVGPRTEKADGFGTVWLILDKGESVTLYLMRSGKPLCPINKERAERTWEFDTPEEARDEAQRCEDRIQANALKLLAKIDNIWV